MWAVNGSGVTSKNVGVTVWIAPCVCCLYLLWPPFQHPSSTFKVNPVAPKAPPPWTFADDNIIVTSPPTLPNADASKVASDIVIAKECNEPLPISYHNFDPRYDYSHCAIAQHLHSYDYEGEDVNLSGSDCEPYVKGIRFFQVIDYYVFNVKCEWLSIFLHCFDISLLLSLHKSELQATGSCTAVIAVDIIRYI